jgi:hypothetical protein
MPPAATRKKSLRKLAVDRRHTGLSGLDRLKIRQCKLRFAEVARCLEQNVLSREDEKHLHTLAILLLIAIRQRSVHYFPLNLNPIVRTNWTAANYPIDKCWSDLRFRKVLKYD